MLFAGLGGHVTSDVCVLIVSRQKHVPTVALFGLSP